MSILLYLVKFQGNPRIASEVFFLFLTLPFLRAISNKVFLSFKYSFLSFFFGCLLEEFLCEERCGWFQIKLLCLLDLSSLSIVIGHPLDIFLMRQLTLT